MNVSELARQLRIHPKEMLQILPQYGFDIGMKAVKIDDKVASQIVKQWKYIKREIENKKLKEAEEKKLKEKELRRESGLTVSLPHIITVREFADRMQLPVTQVIMELMKNGILANQNQNIDYDTAAIMAGELGYNVEKEEGDRVASEKELKKEQAIEAALSRVTDPKPRAPVVVVMGHVDHGKTSLLDTIRQANITSTESGGITQHIGAYQTIWKDPKTKDERAITFIDTPGHEAFTVMRSRGAKIADIAILVVAADDGVKPQTIEVIQIIKAAKLPIVVALNKIDKEGADAQRVKTELSTHDIIPEEWGGNVPVVEISAKKKLNIDKLLDVLLLVSDVNAENIQADPNIPAVGTIIESNMDKNIGPVATVLIQAGTLRKNDPLVVHGEIYGKVRAMKNYRGEVIESAGPSMPAQIIGFKVAPEVGDILDVSLAEGAEKIDVKQKRNQQSGAEKYTVQQTESTTEEDGKKRTLNLVIKADVLGSLEAIIGSFEKIQHDEVGVKIIGKGLGNITEDDIHKAEAGNGILVGFKVRPTPSADGDIREKGMQFHQFDVIYALFDWVKEELTKMLSNEKIVKEIGIMKILAIFRTEKSSMIVGGRVEDGKVRKDCLVRVKRDGEIIGTGKVSRCQMAKSESKEIPSGSEGGITFEGKVKIEEGDVLEAYTEESKARALVFKV